jgi:hypothetical protein
MHCTCNNQKKKKRAGSSSVIQRYGSADPDLYRKFTDPEHCSGCLNPKDKKTMKMNHRIAEGYQCIFVRTSLALQIMYNELDIFDMIGLIYDREASKFTPRNLIEPSVNDYSFCPVSLTYSSLSASCIKLPNLCSTKHTLPRIYTEKKLSFFPSPAGMSLTKLSLAGNNLKIPVQGDFGK